jgi:hypothetical protein
MSPPRFSEAMAQHGDRDRNISRVPSPQTRVGITCTRFMTSAGFDNYKLSAYLSLPIGKQNSFRISSDPRAGQACSERVW